MSLQVVGVHGLVTVQDRGRPGLAHLGVPPSGALDQEAAALGNRIVGNRIADNGPGDAVLEVTLGSLDLRATVGHWCVLTGAEAALTVDGTPQPFAEAVYAGPGALLRISPPDRGVRTYVAVAGGINVPAVLGSRSTDTLAGLGPAPVTTGDVLPVGPPTGHPQPHDVPLKPRERPLRIWPGPRADWFAGSAPDDLCSSAWLVGADSNRIGVRLDGPGLERLRHDELPSEGMVLGAVQVPPDGRPVVLLHDHPVTGGYPVLAVVDRRDLGMLAQARPGDEVRFVRAR